MLEHLQLIWWWTSGSSGIVLILLLRQRWHIFNPFKPDLSVPSVSRQETRWPRLGVTRRKSPPRSLWCPRLAPVPAPIADSHQFHEVQINIVPEQDWAEHWAGVWPVLTLIIVNKSATGGPSECLTVVREVTHSGLSSFAPTLRLMCTHFIAPKNIHYISKSTHLSRSLGDQNLSWDNVTASPQPGVTMWHQLKGVRVSVCSETDMRDDPQMS